MNLPALFRRRSLARPSAAARGSSLERLEPRIAPAVITVAGHTLKIVGEAGDTGLTITDDVSQGVVSFTVAYSKSGAPATKTVGGITDIAIQLGGFPGVNFDGSSIAVALQGGLTISATGPSLITASHLDLGKNLTFTGGTGFDQVGLTDLIVGGNATFKVGDGSSSIGIGRSSAGVSFIHGNLSVTAGAGEDLFSLVDTNVGGNLTAAFGKADPTSHNAGTFSTGLSHNAVQGAIGGNLSVSYLDGTSSTNVGDNLFDYRVGGNATFSYGGAGDLRLHIDGSALPLPVVIAGNLAVKGSASKVVYAGLGGNARGVSVLKGFTYTGGPSVDNLFASKLQVGGATRLALGDGPSNTEIDDSLFVGAFSLTTGKGSDVIGLETTTGTALPTVFQSTATVKLGAGSNAATLSGSSDNGESVVAWRNFSIVAGTGNNVGATFDYPHFIFPFGGEIMGLPA